MAIDNDTRGWIMTGISGVACVVGASVICIDIVVRLFPGMRNFSITESDAFLSASLSLSFGVMLYSALYSMLPQSKSYLEEAGYSPQAASYMLIGLFLGGVIGIRLLSSVLHSFIPSHVVDCDHTHGESDDEDEAKINDEEATKHKPQTEQSDERTVARVARVARPDGIEASEDTPLLSRTNSDTPPRPLRTSTAPDGDLSGISQTNAYVTAPSSRRVSMLPRGLSRTLTKFVSARKHECDESGPCKGYSDPCGQDCFRAVQRRLPGSYAGSFHRQPTWPRQPRGVQSLSTDAEVAHATGEGERSLSCSSRQHGRSRAPSCGHSEPAAQRSRSSTHHYHHPEHDRHAHFPHSRTPSPASHHHSVETDHHHHVPTNAFMSIGLQTSLAIALHKLPEGFITYATNHANPTLGFAVFMALFMHNITEGFAMSLPLYLALKSRTKAIVWSSFLGGVSQPLGAGIAALWFHLAADGKMAPNQGVYGAMFAITSGIMTSVALSLFSESLQLSHNKGTCIAFAFLGMGILGFSYALTAK